MIGFARLMESTARCDYCHKIHGCVGCETLCWRERHLRNWGKHHPDIMADLAAAGFVDRPDPWIRCTCQNESFAD